MDVIVTACSDFLSKLPECCTVSILGLIALLYCSVYILHATLYVPFKVFFLAQVLPGVDLKKLGKWAVITGATDGIGKEYANVLAKKGLDIVLISRTPEKLNRVANEIKTEHNVQVQTIAVDFKQTDIYSKIEKALEGLDIAILVNNVAIGNPLGTFPQHENVFDLIVDQVHVNCVSMMNMCAIVLPGMLQKNKGVIVNVSSLASHGFIGGTPYSATKAYASKASECIRRTYRSSGVIIQTIEPGMVETNMLDGGFMSEVVPDFMNMARRLTAVPVSTFVQSAVNTIGWADHTTGHFKHYLVHLITKVQPESYRDNRIINDLAKAFKRN